MGERCKDLLNARIFMEMFPYNETPSFSYLLYSVSSHMLLKRFQVFLSL